MTYLEEDELTDELVFEPEPEEATPPAPPPGPDPRIEMARKILAQLHESLGHVISLLEGASTPEETGSTVAALVSVKKGM
jgi:hypothetical protein